MLCFLMPLWRASATSRSRALPQEERLELALSKKRSENFASQNSFLRVRLACPSPCFFCDVCQRSIQCDAGQFFDPSQSDLMVRQTAPVLRVKLQFIKERREQRLKILPAGLIRGQAGLKSRSGLRNQALLVNSEQALSSGRFQIVATQIRIGLLDSRVIRVLRLRLLLFCFGKLATLPAPAVNGNAGAEGQHVVSAILRRIGALPHVLHIEIGIKILMR